MIPTFEDAEARCDAGQGSALDAFIYHHEPAGPDDIAFRTQLNMVVHEAASYPARVGDFSKLQFINAMRQRDFNTDMDSYGEFVNYSTNAMWVGWEAAHGR